MKRMKLFWLLLCVSCLSVNAQRFMDKLDRGLVATSGRCCKAD